MLTIKGLVASSLILSVLLMAGCGSDEAKAPEPVQSTDQEPNHTEEKDKVKEEKNVYIDEAGYEGDELEMIKVVNLSTKYRNEGNEDEFLKLFNPNHMKTLTPMKVESIQLESINFMSENVGSVRTTIKYDTKQEPGIALFVFDKTDDKWIISGTD
ncbi:hypothetical protein ACWIE6_18880 [Paenibacillus taichungensis]|uniref:hypothetical protein n=1 Tax=Paenibacillus TaxID=44249 RepID=UPI00089049E6|nr:hypothetical protein [Paenibacillus sp. OK060]SDM33576.1 hypothetical protein SAMN05428961_11446 [Paenibacillus sp. OK060]